MPNYLMVLMAVSVGGMVVLQAGSNALLGRLLGHPLSASLTSLGVSLGVVSLGLLLVRVPLPAIASLGGAPWWSWLGGLFGAAYLTVAILVARAWVPPLSSRAWWRADAGLGALRPVRLGRFPGAPVVLGGLSRPGAGGGGGIAPAMAGKSVRRVPAKAVKWNLA